MLRIPTGEAIIRVSQLENRDGRTASYFLKTSEHNIHCAHFGWLAGNLQALGALLDSLPNVQIEFAAILEEIGRQPRNARKFFIKYQDRILFGKDTWSIPEYGFYFRMLETDDEYFPPLRKYHAFWNMYGLGLPDDVLKKNLQKRTCMFPQIDKSLFQLKKVDNLAPELFVIDFSD